MGKHSNTEPPTWWLFLGVTLILSGLVALMFMPGNSWGV